MTRTCKIKYWIHHILVLAVTVLAACDLRAEAGDGVGAAKQQPQSVHSLPVKNFKVFDGTLYKNKPDLSVYGISPIKIIYGQDFWKDKSQMNKLPDERTARRLAREAAAQGILVCLDIEHWPIRGDDAAVATGVKKYSQLIQWFHEERPNAKYGYYSLPPVGDYWRVMGGPASEPYKAWQTDNDRLKPLADKVDVLFPSLYTFYLDRGGWVKFAIGQIEEARRYGKPVYVFLWPQFHDSNRILGLRFIPPDYWKLELETVRAHADGVVIWGGWNFEKNEPADWDDRAPWWLVTKEFMGRLGH